MFIILYCVATSKQTKEPASNASIIETIPAYFFKQRHGTSILSERNYLSKQRGKAKSNQIPGIVKIWH